MENKGNWRSGVIAGLTVYLASSARSSRCRSGGRRGSSSASRRRCPGTSRRRARRWCGRAATRGLYTAVEGQRYDLQGDAALHLHLRLARPRAEQPPASTAAPSPVTLFPRAFSASASRSRSTAVPLGDNSTAPSTSTPRTDERVRKPPRGPRLRRACRRCWRWASGAVLAARVTTFPHRLGVRAVARARRRARGAQRPRASSQAPPSTPRRSRRAQPAPHRLRHRRRLGGRPASSSARSAPARSTGRSTSIFIL